MCEGTKPKTVFQGQKGFILAEVALGMIIMGLIGLSAYHTLHRFQSWSRFETTKRHQDMIWRSLEGYLSHHGCLPYASKLEDQGKARDHLDIGYVPYVTLGLMPSVAKDGYGKEMIYAVDKQWTIQGHGQREALCQSLFAKPSSLEVKRHKDSVMQQTQASFRTYHDGIAAVVWSTKDSQKILHNRGKAARVVLSYTPSKDPQITWRTRSFMIRAVGLSCFDVLFAQSHQVRPTIRTRGGLQIGKSALELGH